MPPKKTNKGKKMVTKPSHKPTEEQRLRVEQGAALGIPQENLAGLMKIDVKTLRKHYREELDHGATKANMVIGGALFNKAKGGDTAALIFWAKTRMGFKETQVQEIKGEGVNFWGNIPSTDQ